MKQSEIFIILLVLFVTSNADMQNHTIFSLLPIGEYRLHVENILPCDIEKRNKIQINWLVSKTSRTKAEFKGNTTFGVPFSDNLNLKVIFDQASSYGVWALNSLIVKKEKACTSFVSLVKESYHNALGCNGTCSCPIPAGVLQINGFPATNVENAFKNLPITLAYGTYRLRFIILNKKNEEIGCEHVVLDVKRP